MATVAAWLNILATAVAVVVPLAAWVARSNRSLEQRLETKFDVKFDVVDARFEAMDAKFTARLDAMSAVVDHRLGALESDMYLVKQHLLGTSSPT